MDLLFLLLGTAFVSCTIVVLFLKPARRDVILNRLQLRRRRASGAATPPRSLSPDNKNGHDQRPQNDWSDSYPPSLRHVLAEIPGLADKLGKSKDDLMVPPEKWENIPLATELEDAKEHMVTPCGFTVREIKALGDFPDYAALSGVPLPKAYPEFDIKRAKPRPYRPFRWAYHQTMSLQKMEPDWWLELENTYEARIKQRQDLFAQHGDGVLQALPGTRLACKELMEMVLQFLCARYPHYFRLDADKMVFHNGILHTETDLKTTHPLHVLLNNVPEDFAIMMRDPDTGAYRFRAGVICSALGWNVESKIDRTLPEIHGPIPDYKEKMAFSMDRYFSKKPTAKPIQRGSWGLEIGHPLYMPPDDPHAALRLTQAPALPLAECHLRVDWQTLRRVPLSGAVVFNFKALFTPVEALRDEPFVPALVSKVLREGKKSIMVYKGTWHVEHVVGPALERYAEEQVQRGWVPRGWEVRTLEESPWFPGWEGKWRGEQGF